MFADLLLETHRFLVTSKVSVEEFRIFVSFMSASKVNSSSLFFRDRLPSLTLATTIDQIFTIINENQYWNHFNYQLLEAIVKSSVTGAYETSWRTTLTASSPSKIRYHFRNTQSVFQKASPFLTNRISLISRPPSPLRALGERTAWKRQEHCRGRCVEN